MDDRREYTETYLDLVADVADKLHAVDCGCQSKVHTPDQVDYYDRLAEAALDAVTAAGRLVPELAARSADLHGHGFVYVDPRGGTRHVLNPADVIVVLPPEPKIGKGNDQIC
jgi:hypothetical protein